MPDRIQTPAENKAALLMALAREHRRRGSGAAYIRKLEEEARRLAPHLFADA